MQQHDHIHHFHQLDNVHYDTDNHDHYPRHHHEWAGNQFNTVSDQHDFDCHADDHNLVTGDDFDHPGYDIRWADNHSRTTPTPHHTASVAGHRH